MTSIKRTVIKFTKKYPSLHNLLAGVYRKIFPVSDDLFPLLNQYDIDLCMDVGANTGMSGFAYRAWFPNVLTLSYEPVLHLYERLKAASSRDPKWHAYNLGIGASESEQIIQVGSGHSGTSSFLKFNTDYMSEHAASVAKVTHQEQVQIKTLDFCIENHAPDSKCIFIKVDTQGYELKVMEGLQKYQNKVLIVKLEMCLTGKDYEGQPLYYEIIRYMNKRGFILIDIEEAHSNYQTGEILYLDGKFMNTNHPTFRAK